jgi:hypothetical protein
MYILVLHEKHGDRYINAGDSEESIGQAANAVVKERIKAGYWYNEDEARSAEWHLLKNKGMSWLRTRSTREYEGTSVKKTEVL